LPPAEGRRGFQNFVRGTLEEKHLREIAVDEATGSKNGEKEIKLRNFRGF